MNRQLRRMQKKTAGAASNGFAAPPEIAGLVNLGIQRQKLGQFDEAAWYYGQALAQDPNQLSALCNLGKMLVDFGRHDQGQAYLKRAIQIRPKFVEAAESLMLSYVALEQYEAAVKLAKSMVPHFPERPTIWKQLGFSYYQLEKFVESAKAFEKILEIVPGDEETILPLVSCYTIVGRYKDAVELLKSAVSRNSGQIQFIEVLVDILITQNRYFEITKYLNILLSNDNYRPSSKIYASLAGSYYSLNDIEPAILYLEKALEIEPVAPDHMALAVELYTKTLRLDKADLWLTRFEQLNFDRKAALNFRGIYNFAAGDFPGAERVARVLIAEYPHFEDGYLKLIFSLTERGKYAEGLELAHQALEIFSESAFLYNWLAICYRALGDQKQAQAYALLAGDAADEISEDDAFDGALFTMHYESGANQNDIFNATVKAVEKFYGTIISKDSHANTPVPERRLKVGYVSADFWRHPVSDYIEPVLAHHDRSAVEVYCYSNGRNHDAVTDRIKGHADHWRTIYDKSHHSTARLIESDGIDILIDLSGWTRGHRLPVFARKPAPIQATWIGYFNTTGLKAMDYLITDATLVPPEEEHLYTESPLRLPLSSACYKVPEFDIQVGPLPALRNGHITFGCFTAQSKHSDLAIESWGKILSSCPNSVLFFKTSVFEREDIRQSYRDRFEAMGIDPKRLRFEGTTDMVHYLGQYNEVDLMLDTFPYNAATTCLQALWMGVPQISMRGNMLVSRIGDSLMTKVGLSEFVALTPEDYVAKAVEYAARPDRLAEIRARLRQTLTNSPMTNPKAFTEGYEAALRGAWRKWCEEQGSGHDA